MLEEPSTWAEPLVTTELMASTVLDPPGKTLSPEAAEAVFVNCVGDEVLTAEALAAVWYVSSTFTLVESRGDPL